MKANCLLALQPRILVWRPMRLLVLLLLSVGLMLTASIPPALAAPSTSVAHTSAVPSLNVADPAVGEVPADDAETFDDSDHEEQLADTGAQRILLMTLGGLLSIGAGLTAWWVSRRSTSRH